MTDVLSLQMLNPSDDLGLCLSFVSCSSSASCASAVSTVKKIEPIIQG